MLERELLAEAAEVLAEVAGHGRHARRAPCAETARDLQQLCADRARTCRARDRAKSCDAARIRSTAVLLVTRPRLACRPCSPVSRPSRSTASPRGASPSRSTCARGLPAFTIVGRGDAAVRESRERVHAAMLNSRLRLPAAADHRQPRARAPAQGRPRLRPRDRRAACSRRPSRSRPAALERWAVFGELALGGELRHCRGALAVAEGARRARLDGLIVPRECAREAALVDGSSSPGVTSLREVAAILRGGAAAEPAADAAPRAGAGAGASRRTSPTCAATRHAIRALTIAAAGGHNLLLSGPAGHRQDDARPRGCRRSCRR